jgi:hypothetical protein
LRKEDEMPQADEVLLREQVVLTVITARSIFCSFYQVGTCSIGGHSARSHAHGSWMCTTERPLPTPPSTWLNVGNMTVKKFPGKLKETLTFETMVEKMG